MLDIQVASVRRKTDYVPETALILGSGLGNLFADMTVECTVPYAEIEGFPVSTTPTHKSELIFGTVAGKRIAVFSGRFHLYEGYTAQECVMTVRLAKALGAKRVILTNASGGINKNLNAGDLMLVKDHIACFVPSPLIGRNDDSIGVRFPDSSNVYDKELRRKVKHIALENGIALKEGVYVQLTGPQYETPAEIKMLAAVGADAVGMSTAIEAVAANHCGLEVINITLISNLACGLLDKPLTIDEVNEAGKKITPQFETLLREIIRYL